MLEYTVKPFIWIFSFIHSSTFNLFFSWPFLFPSFPEKSIRVGGPRKSPAVGNCRFYDALEGFPPGDRVQSKQGFLKSTVETPSSAMRTAFLPYKAPKYTNTTANPAVCALRPVKPSWALDDKMKTSHDFYLYVQNIACDGSYSALPVATVCTALTWWNALIGHLGLQWRLYRFPDFYGFCGAIKKQLGVWLFFWFMNDGSFVLNQSPGVKTAVIVDYFGQG